MKGTEEAEVSMDCITYQDGRIVEAGDGEGLNQRKKWGQRVRCFMLKHWKTWVTGNDKSRE